MKETTPTMKDIDRLQRWLTLGANVNWCEIQVVQHARPKSDPTSQDRGWVNKQFLKFD